MKKALAILYSPKTLVDFIWYYHTFGIEYSWDVICVPCGGKVIIDKYCVNSEIFSNVYLSDPLYKTMSLKEMAILFGKMSFAWITRKKKRFVQRYFEKYIEKLDYDLHLVPSEYSVLCGLLISLSSEVDTVILEDGLGDYADKSKNFSLEYGINIENISSFFLSFMGYGSGVGDAHYRNKPSCLCIKYVVHPEWMLYRNYKEIRVLRELTNTNVDAWKKCLRKTFCVNGDQKFVGDVILFTTPLESFSGLSVQELVDDVIQYIIYKYNPQKIYIKKHHRDNMKYIFPSAIEVNEIEKNIPGELILDLIQCKKHIYMYPSNMLVSYKDYTKCDILKFKKLIKQSNTYKEIFEKTILQVKLPHESLSEL